jgi:hypothetical protein
VPEKAPCLSWNRTCRFYSAYNAGDIDTIASVMAPDVTYHDMIFEEPFRGREEVVAYMRKVGGWVGFFCCFFAIFFSLLESIKWGF